MVEAVCGLSHSNIEHQTMDLSLCTVLCSLSNMYSALCRRAVRGGRRPCEAEAAGRPGGPGSLRSAVGL